MIGQTVTFHLWGKPFDQSEFVLFIILIDNFPRSESEHVYDNQIYRICQTHSALLLLLAQPGIKNMWMYQHTIYTQQREWNRAGNILSVVYKNIWNIYCKSHNSKEVTCTFVSKRGLKIQHDGCFLECRSVIIQLKRVRRNSGRAFLEDIRQQNGNFRLGLFHRIAK